MFAVAAYTSGAYTGDTLTNLMSDTGTVLDQILTLAMKVVNFIVSNPITLLTFILVVIGLAIGLVSKFRRA